MTKNILITKKSGDLESFKIEKLRNSLRRSGADQKSIEIVIAEVNDFIQSGMSTQKVYRKAYSILSKLSHQSAGRYRLKKAIMDLGPTGYPFERFIGAILEHQGYKVSIGKTIEGKCIKHEIDVLAEDEKNIIVIECKFHRAGNRKSDVKVPLYIHSRFNDIYNRWIEEGRINNRKFKGWIVTNTRFTEDAEAYGRCSNLELISWDYPKNNSLRQRIDRSGLHPITSLKTLNMKDKKVMLEQGIVLCREITEEVLLKQRIPQNKIKKIMDEVCDITVCYEFPNNI